MAARKKKKAKKAAAASPRVGTIKASFYSLLAAVVVVYVAGYLFARTDGFRALLQDRAEKQVGERIEIGTSRATLSGDIVLGDLSIPGPGPSDEPVAGAAHVRLDLSLKGLLTGGLLGGIRGVEVKDWHVAFRLNEEGAWHPAGFAVAGEWLGRWGGMNLPAPPPRTDAASKSSSKAKGTEAVQPWHERIRVDLDGGAMVWFDGEQDLLARIEGICFTVTPLALPKRSATHYHLHVDAARFQDRGGLRDLDVEIIRTGGQYLVLDLQAVRQAGEKRARPVEVAPRPSAAPETGADGPTEFDDAHALQARIRAELEEALDSPTPP